MEKGTDRNSSKASGRFSALAFAATLAFGLSAAMAADAPKADKSAAQGVVAEKAIHADGGGDCAKAKEDCPKEAKADCCKKGAKGAKGAGHHKHGQMEKGAEANAAPAGAPGKTDKPAATPTEADKGASHPG
ncbi:MAG: hypothetical protein ABIW76_11585 [Fibrobacteria bacterium]